MGQDVIEKIQQGVTKRLGRGGLQARGIVGEEVRNFARLFVRMEYAAVHGEDKDSGLDPWDRGSRGSKEVEVWAFDEHRAVRLPGAVVHLRFGTLGWRCRPNIEVKRKIRATAVNFHRGGNYEIFKESWGTKQTG
ncbi:MAG: hypothetical protein H8K05_20915 [Nitrospira sp.]|nr:hypothetical protein [Nitrospira sp.]